MSSKCDVFESRLLPYDASVLTLRFCQKPESCEDLPVEKQRTSRLTKLSHKWSAEDMLDQSIIPQQPTMFRQVLLKSGFLSNRIGTVDPVRPDSVLGQSEFVFSS